MRAVLWVVVALWMGFLVGRHFFKAPVLSPQAAATVADGSVQFPTVPGRALSGAAPSFHLQDGPGRSVGLKNARGKVLVLAFLRPGGQHLTPLTIALLKKAQAALGAKSGAVDWWTVTVGGADAQWAAKNLPSGWEFLMGPASALHTVWAAYHVDVHTVNGVLVYTPAVYIIDSKGQWQRVLVTAGNLTASRQGTGLAAEVQAMLGAQQKG